MSAFIVTEKHIAALVGYYARMRNFHDSCERLDEIGQLLWNENVQSVNFRYNETSEAPPFTYISAYSHSKLLPAISASKQAQCVAYQSCEHDGWEKSEAKEICDAIESHALHEFLRTCPEYNEAPWGLS